MNKRLNKSHGSTPWKRLALQRLHGLHRLAAVGLASLLLILLNLLAAKFDVQWRFASGESAGLSERAETLLATTSGKVAVKVLLPRNHQTFEPLRQLLENMRDAAAESGGAELELEYVDPHRDLARAALLAQRYNIEGWQVLFVADDRVEKVSLTEMVEVITPREETVVPTAPQRSRFRGEQLCVTALARLARPQRPQIYALAGHGERDFDNYDPMTGYSDLAREIRREGYRLQTLSLSRAGAIPDD